MKFIPHTNEDTKEMLVTCKCEKVEDLFKSIPNNLRTGELNLPSALSEPEVVRYFKDLSSQNIVFKDNFLGAGLYRHYIPAAVSSLASRAEFVTPYTPYQPELSQGTLQVIYEYQSFICRLTGMDVSNASHYDGATAAAEAGLIARRITKKNKLIVPDVVLPIYSEVIKTVCGEVDIVQCPDGKINIDTIKTELDSDVAAIFLPFPNVWGVVEDYADISDIAKDKGVVVVAIIPEPLSLAMFNAPSDWGADIVVGEGTSFGMPVAFGGPTLGIFACKEKYIRHLPGRLCGETVDKDGRKSYVLTLATREQHIRRQRATSNICSNQALCATSAAMYISLLGGCGLKDLAKINYDKANYAKDSLLALSGVSLAVDGPIFNEFTIKFNKQAKDVIDYCKSKGILAGISGSEIRLGEDNKLVISCTELNSKKSIDKLVSTIGEALR